MAESNPDNSNDNSQSIDFTCLNNHVSQHEQNENFKNLFDEAIQRQTGFDKEERREALELLTSGKFRSDLKDIVILTVSTTPKTIGAVPDTIKTLDELPSDLSMCLAKRECRSPKAVKDIIKRIYGDPSVKVQRQTLVALLENRSFRLALIVYAKSNGIDIDNADLNFVQSQLQQEHIDMAELVAKGEQRLKEKYKIDEVEARLECLKQ